MNIEKLNSFLECDYDEDIKQFVFDLLEMLCATEFKLDIAEHLFLDLGFFELIDVDFGDEKEFYVLDFYTLSKLDKRLRKVIFSGILKEIKDDRESEIFSEMILKLGIVIEKDKWEKRKMKNKLESLNT